MIYLIKSLNDGLYSINSNQIFLISHSVNWTILGKVAKLDFVYIFIQYGMFIPDAAQHVPVLKFS